jgi:hypothetical protein
MTKIVKGGIVYRNNQTEELSASVQEIEFPNVAPAVTVPVGAQGTMLLTGPPPKIGHYDKGDILYYRDGNNNNNATLKVDENVGPSKYKITVTQ